MPGPHLDDERLSALIDRVAADTGVGDDAHLASCDVCARRARAFTAARDLVARPVAPLPAADVDRFVSVAMGSRREATVTPITATTRHRPRWAAASGWVAAVAAVVAMLLAAPALLGSGGDDGGDVASEPTADESAGAVAVGDADATMERSTAAASGAGTDNAEGYQSAGGSQGAAMPAYDDPDALVRDLVAQMSTSQLADDDEGTVPCVEEARRLAAGRVSSLVYSSQITWRGEQATVLVFALTEPEQGLERQAYVMASTCVVLAEPRF